MKLILRTTVQQSYLQVWRGFDETLFRRLSPPFPPVRVVRFDGCLKGNIVELELNFFLFKQLWTSKITEQQGNAEEVFLLTKV